MTAMTRCCEVCVATIPAERQAARTCSVRCTMRLSLRGAPAGQGKKRRPGTTLVVAAPQPEPEGLAAPAEEATAPASLPFEPEVSSSAASIEDLAGPPGNGAVPATSSEVEPTPISTQPQSALAEEPEEERPAPGRPVCTECDGEIFGKIASALTCSTECADARRIRIDTARRVRDQGERETRRTGRPPKTQPFERLRQRIAGEPLPVAAPTGRADREFDCTHYDDCLDLAVRQDWPGWECSECPIRGTCSAPKDAVLERATWGGSSIAAQLAETRTEAQVVRLRRGRRRLVVDEETL